MQCGPSCTGPACEASRVIDEGISLPLEIFRTENSGWGLRCSCDIAIGTFICEYAGEIIADSEAVSHPICHVSQEYMGLTCTLLFDTVYVDSEKLPLVKGVIRPPLRQLDLCVSSLRRGHANLLCIVPILSDFVRRQNGFDLWTLRGFYVCYQ
jgi:hypothetical protein